MSGDVKIARQLLEEKVTIRDAERVAAEHHLARLRDVLETTGELQPSRLRALEAAAARDANVGDPGLAAEQPQ
jgi:Na+/phosphate symporter